MCGLSRIKSVSWTVVFLVFQFLCIVYDLHFVAASGYSSQHLTGVAVSESGYFGMIFRCVED